MTWLLGSGRHLLVMRSFSPAFLARVGVRLETTGSCSVQADKALGTSVKRHMLSEAHLCCRSQEGFCM